MGFLRQTVDSIVADIQSKVERLHIVAEAKAAEAEVHNAIVAERQKLAAEAKAVEARARSVAQKFANLIEADL